MFSSHAVKKVIQRRLDDVRFINPDTNNQLRSALVYSRHMSAHALATRLLHIVTLTGSTQSSDDSDDSSCASPFKLPLHHVNFKLEYRHVCEAIQAAFNDIPKDYDCYPPTLDDFSPESCLKYCPPILFNLVAWICGLTGDDESIIEHPHDRVKLDVTGQNKVASICQDIVYLWSKGRIQTPKSLALGMTVRHLTSNKRVIELLYNFGHTISFHKLLRFETALAARQQALTIPASFSAGVWSAVTWDNIDFSNETISGSGSVHYVNGILMQQQTATCPPPDSQSVQIGKGVNRLPEHDKGIAEHAPSAKKQGPTINTKPATSLSALKKNYDDFLYIIVKHVYHNPKQIPAWTEFNQIINESRGYAVQPTLIHYLPLIEAPATDEKTITTILQRTLEIADALQLERIVAVFDLAIYCKVQMQRWADPSKVYLDRIIPRLGEFHTIMSFLGILGKRFGPAGLSDIWIESDVVAAGSINAALQGKHYNRAVRGHKIVFEALFRHLLQDYLESLSEEKQNALLTLSDNLSTNYRDISNDYDADFIAFYDGFSNYLYNRADGNPTFEFWLSYLQMVQLLLAFIRASRLSDWDEHLNCIDNMIPWYFAYDRRNYAR